MELNNREKEILRTIPIEHLIRQTIRLLEPLRRSIDPATAEDAQVVWELWKKAMPTVVKATGAPSGAPSLFGSMNHGTQDIKSLEQC